MKSFKVWGITCNVNGSEDALTYSYTVFQTACVNAESDLSWRVNLKNLVHRALQ